MAPNNSERTPNVREQNAENVNFPGISADNGQHQPVPLEENYPDYNSPAFQIEPPKPREKITISFLGVQSLNAHITVLKKLKKNVPHWDWTVEQPIAIHCYFRAHRFLSQA